MSLDILCPVCTESFVRIALQQRSHDGLRIMRHVWWEEQGIRQDTLIHHVDILVVEGWQAGLQSLD